MWPRANDTALDFLKMDSETSRYRLLRPEKRREGAKLRNRL